MKSLYKVLSDTLAGLILAYHETLEKLRSQRTSEDHLAQLSA